MSETPISDNTKHNVAELGMLCRRLERENNELVRLGNELCDWLESLTQETHMAHLCLEQRRTLKQDIKNWRKATE